MARPGPESPSTVKSATDFDQLEVLSGKSRFKSAFRSAAPCHGNSPWLTIDEWARVAARPCLSLAQAFLGNGVLMALDFNPQRDLMMAFTTPLAQIRVSEAAEINPGLKRLILEREAAEPSRSRSNVGGWHSRDDLLTWGGNEIAVLDRSFREAARHMMALINQPRRCELDQELVAWANVCRAGHYHAPHTHPNHHWSGVYYVEAGTAAPDWPRSGVLELQDPRGCVDMAGTPGNPFGRTIAIAAATGMMAVFPSWLYHWVNPYHGEGERISIAFNSRITKFKTLDAPVAEPPR